MNKCLLVICLVVLAGCTIDTDFTDSPLWLNTTPPNTSLSCQPIETNYTSNFTFNCYKIAEQNTSLVLGKPDKKINVTILPSHNGSYYQNQSRFHLPIGKYIIAYNSGNGTIMLGDTQFNLSSEHHNYYFLLEHAEGFLLINITNQTNISIPIYINVSDYLKIYWYRFNRTINISDLNNSFVSETEESGSGASSSTSSGSSSGSNSRNTWWQTNNLGRVTTHSYWQGNRQTTIRSAFYGPTISNSTSTVIIPKKDTQPIDVIPQDSDGHYVEVKNVEDDIKEEIIEEPANVSAPFNNKSAGFSVLLWFLIIPFFLALLGVGLWVWKKKKENDFYMQSKGLKADKRLKSE